MLAEAWVGIMTQQERTDRERERSRRYYAANKEAINARRKAQRKAQRQADPDKSRREWAARSTKVNAARRQKRAANPAPYRERERRWQDANREQIRHRDAVKRHGPGIAAVSAAMWEAQQGQCYLCGIYLVPDFAVIDHDHRCCPKDRSCPSCRRGLACDYCNTLIGLADDDPALLRQIADRLESARAAVDDRLAGAS